jgi:hypothetical protein
VIGRAGTGAPGNADEFQAVSASDLEGEWSTNSCAIDLGTTVGNLKNGEPLVALTFGRGRLSQRIYQRQLHGTFTATKYGEIDLTFTVGLDTGYFGGVQKGLYQIEGETLTLFLGAPGEARPLSFADRPDSSWTILVLKLWTS